MKEKKQIKEKNLHHMCHEHFEKEVEVITLQGDFSGKLVEIEKEAIILESTRMRQQSLRILIRIDAIVAIYPVEINIPRGPFDFGFPVPNFEQQPAGESNE